MRRWFFIGLPLVLIATHALLWWWCVRFYGMTWLDLLNNYDSGWYNRIVFSGYADMRWAFFPLYPLLTKIVMGWTVVPAQFQYGPVYGSALSTTFFLLCCACILVAIRQRVHAGVTAAAAQSVPLIGLAPATLTGWFLFLFQPASYVFHSNHTESLFLLLTWLAFFLASRRRWGWAAVVGGLATLARMQGVLAAFAVALLSASQAPAGLRGKGRVFILSGLISASLFSLFPIYQYAVSGDPLACVYWQEHWHNPTATWSIYWRALVMANPWQNGSIDPVCRRAFAVVLILSAIRLWKASPPLAIYVSLSVAIMPLEGDFANIFRFSVVLFPAWFDLGDRCSRMRPWLKLPAVGGLVVLNCFYALRYARGLWAY